LYINSGFLYVGGKFTTILGGLDTANYIARWDIASGTGWSKLFGSSGDGTGGPVYAITFYDPTTIPFPEIVVGGDFTVVDVSLPANNIARWDPNSNTWFQIPDTGGGGGQGTNGIVRTLYNYQVSPLSILYIGGDFTQIASNTISANHIAQIDLSGPTYANILDINVVNPVLNGVQGVGPGVTVNSITYDPAFKKLYIGGTFDRVFSFFGLTSAYNIVIWDITPKTWSNIISPTSTSVNNTVRAVEFDGANKVIWVGGDFTATATTGKSYIGSWDVAASTWDTSTYFNSMNAPVRSIMYDNNTSNVLFGGDFTLAGEATANISVSKAAYMIKTSPTICWNALIQPLDSYGIKEYSTVSGKVYASAIIDNDRIVVGGDFKNAGGIYASNIAIYDINNQQWTPVVDIITRVNGTDNIVRALAYDSNNKLIYIGGDFITAGGWVSNYIVKYDLNTTNFIPIEHTVQGEFGLDGIVRALEYDQGTNMIYVGGDFTYTYNGNLQLSHVAQWDGSVWNQLQDSGGGEGVDGPVYSLSYDNANNVLYVGGSFSFAAGTITVVNIAAWDLTVPGWSAPFSSTITTLGSAGTNIVYAVKYSNAGSPPLLFAGGDFKIATGGAFNYMAFVPVGVSAAFLQIGANTLNGTVRAISLYGPIMLAGGDFTSCIITNNTASSVVNHCLFGKYQGSTTTMFLDTLSPSGTNFVLSIRGNGTNGPVHTIVTNNSTFNTFMGGQFTVAYSNPNFGSSTPPTTIDSVICSNIAGFSFSNEQWFQLRAPVPILDAPVFALTEVPGNLIVGGEFKNVSTTLLSRIGRYNWAQNLWYPITPNIEVVSLGDNAIDIIKISVDNRYTIQPGNLIIGPNIPENTIIINVNVVATIEIQISRTLTGPTIGSTYKINGIVGVDSVVLALTHDTTLNEIYVGGGFKECVTSGYSTQVMNGVGKLSAQWDKWTPYIYDITPYDVGVNDRVRSINLDNVVSPSTLYISGDFNATAINNLLPIEHVAKIDLSTEIIGQIANVSGTHIGLDGKVFAILYKSPSVYFGGSFNNTLPLPDVATKNSAYFNLIPVCNNVQITGLFTDTYDSPPTLNTLIDLPCQYDFVVLISAGQVVVTNWLATSRSPAVTIT
jgi:hypothetical protein